MRLNHGAAILVVEQAIERVSVLACPIFFSDDQCAADAGAGDSFDCFGPALSGRLGEKARHRPGARRAMEARKNPKGPARPPRRKHTKPEAAPAPENNEGLGQNQEP